MANFTVPLNGVWIGDGAGLVSLASLCVKTIIYIPANSGDSVVLYDGADSNETLPIVSSTADPVTIPFSGRRGKVFPRGLYIHSISAGSKVILALD